MALGMDDLLRLFVIACTAFGKSYPIKQGVALKPAGDTLMALD